MRPGIMSDEKADRQRELFIGEHFRSAACKEEADLSFQKCMQIL